MFSWQQKRFLNGGPTNVDEPPEGSGGIDFYFNGDSVMRELIAQWGVEWLS